jgi:5'-nucleotidase (lipoprotein e(P4) family)
MSLNIRQHANLKCSHVASGAAMQLAKILSAIASVLVLAGCAYTEYDPNYDSGIFWVKDSAEYQAVSMQIYSQATADIANFVADTSWTAMPDQIVDPQLPAAIIFDIDQTLVSGAEFQLVYERPYSNKKRDAWSQKSAAAAVPGVIKFVAAARMAGVETFFVTNRPCEQREGDPKPCPQFQTALDDLREIGIEVSAYQLSLSGQQANWDREKLVRRKLIAESYRVIMVIGDDLGDFVPCSRTKVMATCHSSATAESRKEAMKKYEFYWGHGWYILPNPMHGSWTSVL